MKLSIVIPVFNEIKTLNDILTQVKNVVLPDKITSREIVLVDDYSTDGTRNLLSEIKDENIKIFYHEKNKGKGAALRTGFQNVTGDIVLIQDADLEYDPGEYPKLLKPILDGKADVVYGSRFIGDESHRILYFWHSLANKCLTLLSNMFSDLNLTDMETCYKVFKKKVIEQLVIEENRFGFEPEITAKISEISRKEGIRIYEVGISYDGRTYDEGKKIGLKDAFRAFWCIFKYNTSNFAHIVKYGLCGLLIALSQFLVFSFFKDYLGYNTEVLRNFANVYSIIIGLLVAFFLHSLITWDYRFKNVINFFVKLLTFYIVSGISIVIRLLLFYLLLKIGLQDQINLIIGIVVIIVINFLGYDKIVFKQMEKRK